MFAKGRNDARMTAVACKHHGNDDSLDLKRGQDEVGKTSS